MRQMRQMRLIFGDAFSQISDKLDRPIISPEQMQQIVSASTEAAIRAMRAEMRAARESEDAEHQRREAAAANAPYWRRGLAIVRRYGPEVGKAIQTVDAVVQFAGRVQGARRWLSA